MMDAKLLGKLYAREAYASGLPVPHLAGLIYLVKIAANGFGLRVERNERHEALERLELLKLFTVPNRQYGRVNCNEEVPLHFRRLAPGN